MQALSFRGRCGLVHSAPIRKQCGVVRPKVVVRAEEPRVVREYREGDDKIIESGSQASNVQPASNPNSVYADELPEAPRSEMSPEMKARLRAEYLGLSGSPTKAAGGNWIFLISVFVGGLAVLSALLGYI